MKLEEKFIALVGLLQNFFKEDSASSHDFLTINQLRDQALDLSEDALRSHRLSALTTYALSNQTIETEYALHPLQYLCLVLYGTRGHPLDPDQRRELVTAALFCDVGFRLAWPFHSDHATTVLRALGEHRFPWWSLKIEKLISSHHQPEKDPSPHQILSLTARYLELVRGTGVEQSKTDLLSPAKAIQAISEDPLFRLDSRKSFCQHMGPYPVGSWIALNTGRKGLILMIRPLAPQQPILAMPISEGSPRFVLLDAQKSNGSIVAAVPPVPLLDPVFSDPHQWLPGWDNDLAKLEAQDVEFQMPPEVVTPPAEAAPSEPPILRAIPTIQSETPLESTLPIPVPEKNAPSLSPEPHTLPTFIFEIQQAIEAIKDHLHQAYRSAAEGMERLLIQLTALENDLDPLARLPSASHENRLFEGVRLQLARQKQIAETLSRDFNQRWSSTSDAWHAKTQSFIHQLEELKSGKKQGAFRSAEQRWHDELRSELHSFSAKWQAEAAGFAQRIREPLLQVHDCRRTLADLPSLLAEKNAYDLLMQGIEHQKHGRKTEARTALEKAVAQRPLFWEAKALLQVCRFENQLSHPPSP